VDFQVMTRCFRDEKHCLNFPCQNQVISSNINIRKS